MKELINIAEREQRRKFRYQPVKEVQKPPPVPIQVSEEKTDSGTGKTLVPQTEVSRFGQIGHYKKDPQSLRDIEELETFFAGIQLPAGPVKLNQCATIINIPGFIDSHIATAKAQDGNYTYKPYYNRLQELKQILTKSLN